MVAIFNNHSYRQLEDGTPPELYCIQAEEAVLGAILIAPALIKKIAPKLPLAAFHLAFHQRIYQACLTLDGEGTEPDLMNVTIFLSDTGKLEEIGGQSKLAQLVDRTDYIEFPKLQSRIKTLLDKWRRRQLDRAAKITASLATDRFLSPEELAAQLQEQIAKISQSNPPAAPDERLRLEVLAYTEETNPFKKLQLKGEICSRYRISRRDLEELSAEATGQTNTLKAKRYTGEEFLRLEPEGIGWLVPGIIPARGVTILGGAPGSGKTTMAYDLAASVLYNETFLGEEPAKLGQALFVSSDELPCFAQDKLIDRGFEFNQDWQFMSDWDISQTAELEAAIAEFRPTLITIDSFAAIHRDATFDENSAQAKATVYWLEQLTNKYNCAILLIHHCNKNKDQKGVARLRGNTAIAGACSAVLLLEGEGDIKTLAAPKIRGTEPFKWSVKLDRQNGRWYVVEGKEDDSDAKSLSQKILALFQSCYRAARLEISEIHKHVGGQMASIYKALERLVKRGQLIKRPSTKDRRFKVFGLPAGIVTDCEEAASEVSQTTASEVSQTTEILSPPYVPLQVSNNFSQTNIQQEIQVLDTLLDTYSTSDRQIPENSAVEQPSNQEPVSATEKLFDTSSVEGGERESNHICPTSNDGELVAPTPAKTVDVAAEIAECTDIIRTALALDSVFDVVVAYNAMKGCAADYADVWQQMKERIWEAFNRDERSRFWELLSEAKEQGLVELDRPAAVASQPLAGSSNEPAVSPTQLSFDIELPEKQGGKRC